jgi:hypothetical protein
MDRADEDVDLVAFSAPFAGSLSSSRTTYSTSRPPNLPPFSAIASRSASSMFLPSAA